MSNNEFDMEGKVELDFVSNLSEFVDDLARYNEQTGFAEKRMTDLQAALEKVEQRVKGTTSSMTTGAAETAKYAQGFEQMVKGLREYTKLHREAAQAGVVAGSLDGAGRGDVEKLDTKTLREYIAIDDARGVNAIGIARQVVNAREREEAATKKATDRALADIDRETAARSAAYSKRMSEALSIDQGIDADRAAKRYAVPTPASRNSANPIAKAAAQEEYKLQETRDFSRILREQAVAQNLVADAALKQYEAIDKVNKKTSEHTTSLISQRYALYDVASTMGVTGAALLGLVAGYEAVAIARQAAFTDVERTSDLESGDPRLAALRGQLEDITTSIPKTFDEVAGIATLGGQLGVQANDLSKFTETVATFSAVSDVTTEATAQGLGRLGNILGVTAEGYDTLAASIVYAGTKSAATESQILSVAAEIGPSARSFGFAADEVVGLATAYASLQIPGERARGVTGQLFATINSAVRSGGEGLNNFAAISRMSASDFAEGWKTNTAQTVQAFISGLGATKDITTALETLGLQGLRLDPTMRSLAANADLVGESFRNASDGSTNGFMDDAAAKKFETVAAKLQILSSAVQELAAAFGEPGLAAIAEMAGFLADVAENAADFLGTDLGRGIALISTVALVLVGVIASVVSGGALWLASLYAIRTALAGLDGQLTGTQLKMAQFAGGMAGVTITARSAAVALPAVGAGGQVAAAGMTAATVAARTLKLALIGTGVGALIVGLGTLGEAIFGAADGEDDLSSSTDQTGAAMQGQTDVVLENAEAMREATKAAIDFANTQADLEGNLYDLGQSMQKNGNDFSAYSTGGRKNLGALTSTINTMIEAANGSPQKLANLLAGLKQQLAAAGASSEALNLVSKAIDATGVSADRAAITSNSLATGLAHVEKKAKDAAKEVRTVADYANDLSTIFSRSFDLRFGSLTAFDGITTKIQNMTKASDDAKDKVRDLNLEIQSIRATMQGLSADRKVQEYFLSVANSFGDTLRASQIAAEISRIDADMAKQKSDLADKNSDLTATQELVNKSLTGNSAAAIAARGDVVSLIGAYQSYIEQLANSGLSQEELRARTEQLRGEFVSQLTQMGFNREEVDMYAKAFDDFTYIISNFPRNVTLEANTNPAQAAIDEFLAKNANKNIDVNVRSDENVAAQEGRDAGEAFGDAMSSALRTALNNVAGALNAVSSFGKSGAKDPSFMEKVIDNWLTGASAFVNPPNRSGSGGGRAEGGLADIYGGGSGYTGDGSKYEPKSVVHGGEFVFSRQATQNIGVDRLAFEHKAALNGGGGAFGGGGGVMMMGGGGGMTVLSPEDRDLIRGISERPVYLIADGQIIGRLVQSGNVAETRNI